MLNMNPDSLQVSMRRVEIVREVSTPNNIDTDDMKRKVLG
jgi:hypothetical protein